MGSLILAGAIEGGGAGMLANVEHRRASEAKDLDRDHDTALEKMREQAGMNLQASAQEFTTEQYETEKEDAMAALTEERDYAAGLVGPAQAREDVVLEDKQAHALELQELKNTGAISLATAKNNPNDFQSIKLKIEVGRDQFGGMVEGEIPLTFQKSTGRLFQEIGGMLMPYDLISNLPDDEKKLATDPLYGLKYAVVKGGPEKLPEWYKVLHKSTYEDVKKAYKKRAKEIPPSDGGDKGADGMLNEAEKARKTSNTLPAFMTLPADELFPAIGRGAVKAYEWLREPHEMVFNPPDKQSAAKRSSAKRYQNQQ